MRYILRIFIVLAILTYKVNAQPFGGYAVVSEWSTEYLNIPHTKDFTIDFFFKLPDTTNSKRYRLLRTNLFHVFLYTNFNDTTRNSIDIPSYVSSSHTIVNGRRFTKDFSKDEWHHLKITRDMDSRYPVNIIVLDGVKLGGWHIGKDVALREVAIGQNVFNNNTNYTENAFLIDNFRIRSGIQLDEVPNQESWNDTTVRMLVHFNDYDKKTGEFDMIAAYPNRNIFSRKLGLPGNAFSVNIKGQGPIHSDTVNVCSNERLELMVYGCGKYTISGKMSLPTQYHTTRLILPEDSVSGWLVFDYELGTFRQGKDSIYINRYNRTKLLNTLPSTHCYGDTASFQANFNQKILHIDWWHNLNVEVLHQTDSVVTYTMQDRGRIRLTYTDTFGCVFESDEIQNINDDRKELFSTRMYSVCPDEKVTLSASGDGNFDWFSPAGDKLSSGRSGTLSTQQSATFKVKRTDEDGCRHVDSITLNIKKSRYRKTADTVVCKGDKVTLKAWGNRGYSWSTSLPHKKLLPGKNIEIDADTTGYGYLKVNDKNGCQYQDSTFISYKKDAVPKIIMPPKICEGTLYEMRLRGGNQYNVLQKPRSFVKENDSTFSFTNVYRNDSIVQVVGLRGSCRDTTTIKVSQVEEGYFNIHWPSLVCKNTPVHFGYKYTEPHLKEVTWFLDGDSLEHSDSFWLQIQEKATLGLRLLDSGGCYRNYEKVMRTHRQPSHQTVSDDYICKGDSVKLQNFSLGFDSIVWKGPGLGNGINQPDVVVQPPSSQQYTTLQFYDNGCYTRQFVNIVVSDLSLKLHFPDTLVKGDSVPTFNHFSYGGNTRAITTSWSDNISRSSKDYRNYLSLEQNDEVTLAIEDGSCLVKDTQKIWVLDECDAKIALTSPLDDWFIGAAKPHSLGKFPPFVGLNGKTIVVENDSVFELDSLQKTLLFVSNRNIIDISEYIGQLLLPSPQNLYFAI